MRVQNQDRYLTTLKPHKDRQNISFQIAQNNYLKKNPNFKILSKVLKS